MNAATAAAPATPTPMMGLYDTPMWESIRARRMSLQYCSECHTLRYPPGPACPHCLSLQCEWRPVSGSGEILSWVVFHRQYLPAYPVPYNVIAVRLDEGPIMISNLEGEPPEQSWIGSRVHLVYCELPDGTVLPRFTIVGSAG